MQPSSKAWCQRSEFRWSTHKQKNTLLLQSGEDQGDGWGAGAVAGVGLQGQTLPSSDTFTTNAGRPN